MRSATCGWHAVLVAFLSCGTLLEAQQAEFADARVRTAPLFYLAVNAGAAALSAIVFHGPQPVSAKRVLLGSAAGGVIMYAGQRVVGTGEPALRLAGTETVAIGASITRNIAQGTSPLERVTLPFYPFYLTVQRSEPHVRLRASVLAAATSFVWLARGRRPDLLQSLYSGALVFPARGSELECFTFMRGHCEASRVGEHQFGAVAYAKHPDEYTRAHVSAHEFAHVTQDTRDAVLFAIPASDRLAAVAGTPGRIIAKFLVIDGFLPLMATSEIVGPPAFDNACENLSRFYECEAYALAP